MALKIKNNGTAEFRGKNGCRVSFQVLNTATGEIERVRKTFYVKALTRAEKGRCLREFRAELESGLRRDAQTTTFRAYADQWLKDREADPQIADQTIARDRVRVANIDLSLGDMLIGEITRADVKAFQTAIMTTGEDGKAPTVSGRPLSGTTARGIRTTLKAIFQEAVRDELIARNPCDDLRAPSTDTHEKEPLTPQQAARFRALLDAARPKPTLVAFRLMLFAGLRRSEVCALRWSDFDEGRAEVTVSRSLCTATLEFKEPKTAAGYRTIPLDPGTVEYLRRFRSLQTPKLLAASQSVPDSCICAKAGCPYMHPENLGRSLRRFGEANGFEGVTPHILRHTYCTLLFASGADLKTVQTLMGHDDPATTLRVYSHYVESRGIQAAAAVGALMDSLPTTDVIPLERPTGRWGIRARSA